MENTKLPEAKNPIARDEADRMVALIKLDIAKFENEKAQSLAIAANADMMIARSRLAIADLERRVANVDYPEEPEQAPENENGNGASPEA